MIPMASSGLHRLLTRVGFGAAAAHRHSEAYYRPKALCAFRVLGPTAQPAAPELQRLLDDPYVTWYAAVALLYVAPAKAELLAQEYSAATNATTRAIGLQLRQEIIQHNASGL
jgi:hypothetical protein